MDAESENSHAKLTVIALKSIVSGENEEYLKELLASFLQELQSCTDEQLRFILKNVDYEVIIPALAGASGNMCVKFLANLLDRMLTPFLELCLS